MELVVKKWVQPSNSISYDIMEVSGLQQHEISEIRSIIIDIVIV